MSSVNKVILIGNICASPEIRSMKNGDEVVSFSLATNEKWTDKTTGDKKQKAEFHKIVSFNKGINGGIVKYLKKGSKVYVEGQLETRKWTDKSGVDKYTTEIVLRPYNGVLTMLDSKEQSEPKQYASEPIGDTMRDEFDDDIPFAPMDVF